MLAWIATLIVTGNTFDSLSSLTAYQLVAWGVLYWPFVVFLASMLECPPMGIGAPRSVLYTISSFAVGFFYFLCKVMT